MGSAIVEAHEPGGRQSCCHTAFDLRTTELEILGAKGNVTPHGLTDDLRVRVLEYQTNSPPGRRRIPGYRQAACEDLARGWRRQTIEMPHQDGLPGIDKFCCYPLYFLTLPGCPTPR